MYNILISGYYGFNNIGDESILRTVIDNLREKLPDIDIHRSFPGPGSNQCQIWRESRTPDVSLGYFPLRPPL